MLETPLFGRFVGENKRLVFAPPPAYLALVNGTTAVGASFVVMGLLGESGIGPLAGSGWWFLLTGGLVAGAAVWASASLTRIEFDLRERIYRRRQGPGLLPRTSVGPITNLEALVLIAEPKTFAGGNGVTYHLVLYWKTMCEPLMVIQSDSRSLMAGQPIQAAAGPLLQAGVSYARALGIPLYDNSAFPSACPVPLF